MTCERTWWLVNLFIHYKSLAFCGVFLIITVPVPRPVRGEDAAGHHWIEGRSN